MMAMVMLMTQGSLLGQLMRNMAAPAAARTVCRYHTQLYMFSSIDTAE